MGGHNPPNQVVELKKKGISLTIKSSYRLESEIKKLGTQWNSKSAKLSTAMLLELSKRSLKNNEFDSACEYLNNAAKMEIQLGNYEKAIEHLNKAVKTARENNYLKGKIESLSHLSMALFRRGKKLQSSEYIKQSLHLINSTDDFVSKAITLFVAAEIAYYEYKYDESIELNKRALDFWQKAGNINEQANTHLALGYNYLSKFDYLKSIREIELALEKWILVKNLRGQAIANIAKGGVYTLINKKQNALNAYLQAESIFPDEIDFFEKATLFNGLSTIYEDYGDWKTSLKYRQKAIGLFKRDKNPLGILATLPGLIKLNSLINDEEAMFDYYEQTLLLSKELGDNLFIAIAWQQIGDFYLKNNLLQKASVFYKKARTNLKKLGFKRDLALIISRLGEIHQKQNDFILAKKNFHLALKINKDIKNRFAESQNLFHLANIANKRGNLKEALHLINSSIEITESLYGEISDNTLRRIYLTNVFERYELLIHILMILHSKFPNENYNKQALMINEKARARSLLETLRLANAKFPNNISSSLFEKEKTLRANLNLNINSLTGVLGEKIKGIRVSKIEKEITRLTLEYEQVKAEIRSTYKDTFLLKYPDAFDIRKFQNNILDENTILLEYALGQEKSYVWIVGKNETISYELPPRQVIEKYVFKLRKLILEQSIIFGESPKEYKSRLTANQIEYQRVSEKLSDILLNNISNIIKGKKMIIVPDGVLYYLPFSILPVLKQENSSKDLLLYNNEIAYQPSASALLFIDESQKNFAPTDKAIIFADPIFSEKDQRIKQRTKTKEKSVNKSLLFDSILSSAGNIYRLKATKNEANDISRIIGRSKTTTIFGENATRRKMLSLEMKDYKIIHLATHSILNKKKPEFSSIILSRFDKNGSEMNGLLSLDDIYNLNLSAELVVLSSCDSGAGREVKGEGVISLTQGFLQTGSKSVLSSLWKIEDKATAKLMKYFYEYLIEENLPPAEALRKAKIKMREKSKYKSPLYWAGFTIQGEFRYPINFNSKIKPQVDKFAYLYNFLIFFLVIIGIFIIFKFSLTRLSRY